MDLDEKEHMEPSYKGIYRGSKYSCKFCKKRFKQCAALGGHYSKAHPGQSKAYNYKKKVREDRELERNLHREAMNYYFEHYNKRGEANILNRNTIKSIKRTLVITREEFASLKDKIIGSFK
jgi:hypothetical protein